MKHLIGLAAVVLFAVGCKGKDKDSAPSNAGATPVEAKAPTPAVAVAAPTTAPPPPAAAGDQCATPCRLLATTALADMPATCGSWKAPTCATADYDRNCIYAEAGYPFKKKKWKAAFMGWATIRAGFQESDLSAIARQNISALKSQAAQCKDLDTVHPALRTAVVKFLADAAAGRATMPELGMDTTSDPPTELTATQLQAMLADHKEWLKLTPTTRMRAADPNAQTAAVLGDHKLRGVEVDLGGVMPNCTDDEEGCEVGFTLKFLFDVDDKLVAIEQTFSG